MTNTDTPPADDVREALGNPTPLTDDDLLRIADRPGGVNDQLRAAVTAAEIDAAAEVIAEHRAGTVYPNDRSEARAILEAARQVRPHGTVIPTVDEWAAQMDAERARQIEHGYDDAHDAQHGVVHLLNWAIDYARRGNNLAAATMARCALRLPHGTVTDAEVKVEPVARLIHSRAQHLDSDDSGAWMDLARAVIREAAREVHP